MRMLDWASDILNSTGNVQSSNCENTGDTSQANQIGEHIKTVTASHYIKYWREQ
jgi:hypothetical protein